MKPVSYIFLLFTLMACSGEKPRKPHMVAEMPAVFGSYSYEYGGHGIVLNADSSYCYYWGGCLASGRDSGNYSIRQDTIYFKSMLKPLKDTVKAIVLNHQNKPKEANEFDFIPVPMDMVHGQITPLTGDKYLIRSSRIYHQKEKGTYNMSRFWLKEDAEYMPRELLDSTGNGYATLYNGRHRVTQVGLFKQFKLFDGLRYHYDSDLNVTWIDIIRSSLVVRDSFMINASAYVQE